MRVFISYARKDQEFAKKIHNDLKNKGIATWIDSENLLPGQNWRTIITQEIRNSSHFLALLSSQSVSQKGFVQKELKIALEVLDEILESKLYLIPVRIEDCNPNNEKLEAIHWVDLFPNYEEGLEKILSALHEADKHEVIPHKVDQHEIIKILILAANPENTTRLRLDEEVREIEEGLQRSKFRSHFTLQSKWAVRLRDLRRSLLDFEPDIVHFCGHGEENGLMVEDENGKVIVVDSEALSGLFELYRNRVKCVILNSCYSEPQAKAINKYITYVIGMSKSITDRASLEFAVGFYDALGAGKSIEEAFNFGRNAIQLYNIPEYLIPIISRSKIIKKNLRSLNIPYTVPSTT